eukprot:748319-Hanusia_phi.AAC.10
MLWGGSKQEEEIFSLTRDREPTLRDLNPVDEENFVADLEEAARLSRASCRVSSGGTGAHGARPGTRCAMTMQSASSGTNEMPIPASKRGVRGVRGGLGRAPLPACWLGICLGESTGSASRTRATLGGLREGLGTWEG